MNERDINVSSLDAADDGLHLVSALAGLAIAPWPARRNPEEARDPAAARTTAADPGRPDRWRPGRPGSRSAGGR